MRIEYPSNKKFSWKTENPPDSIFLIYEGNDQRFFRLMTVTIEKQQINQLSVEQFDNFMVLKNN